MYTCPHTCSTRSKHSLSPPCRQTLGKVGRVLHVYGDGDLQVEIADNKWTFNPKNVTKLEGDGVPLTPGTSGKSNKRATVLSLTFYHLHFPPLSPFILLHHLSPLLLLHHLSPLPLLSLLLLLPLLSPLLLLPLLFSSVSILVHLYSPRGRFSNVTSDV